MMDVSKILPEEFLNIEEKFKMFFNTFFSNDIIQFYRNYYKASNKIEQPQQYKTVNFLKYIIADDNFDEKAITSNYIKYKWCDKSKYVLYVYADVKENGPFFDIYHDLTNDKWFGTNFNYNICEVIKYNHKYDIKFNDKEFVMFCLYLYFNHIKFKFSGNEQYFKLFAQLGKQFKSFLNYFAKSEII